MNRRTRIPRGPCVKRPRGAFRSESGGSTPWRRSRQRPRTRSLSRRSCVQKSRSTRVHRENAILERRHVVVERQADDLGERRPTGVGGKGEKFDRNDDGKADDPLSASHLTDVVTAEIRVRVFGSRDRGDDGNFGRFVSSVDREYQQLLQQMRMFFVTHALELPRTAQRNANDDAMLDVAKFNDFLARPELQAELKALGDAFQAFVRKHEAEVKEIVVSMLRCAESKADSREIYGQHRLVPRERARRTRGGRRLRGEL